MREVALDGWEIIATRRFIRSQDTERAVVLSLAKPVLSDDGRNHVCRYRLDGLDEPLVQEGCGVDALQALLLTVKMLTADLESISDEEDGGRLRWEFARRPGDLGLPEV